MSRIVFDWFQWGLALLCCFVSIIIVNNKAELIIFMLCSFGLFVTYALAHKGKIKIRLTVYHWHILAICAFCYLSSSWAILSARQSIGKGNTLLEVFIMMSAVFLFADTNKNPVNSLLKIVMWAGFLAVIYIIANYGFITVIELLLRGTRFDNELLNANTIGMMSAYSLLITVYFILYEGFHLWNVMMIPSAIILVVSVSRKAFLILIIGSFLLIILKDYDNKRLLMNFFRVIFILASGALILFLLSKLPVFEYAATRLQNMIDALKGGQNADSSALTRLRLINLGMNIFKEHPVRGIGMDNAGLFVAGLFYKDYYYLHNNYVELLADGGIIGFCLYYAIYIKLIFTFIKYRNIGNREYNIALILLLIVLIMGYGEVSYLSKENYFLLMIIYFTAEHLRNSQKQRYGLLNEVRL